MGRQPSALHPSRGGTKHDSSASALLRVPLDVWLHILRHLPATSYAALSQVCRRLLHLIDQHAWRLLLHSLYPTISLPALVPFHRKHVEHSKHTRPPRLPKRSLEWFACRHAAQLATSWTQLVLEARSIDLPASLGAKTPPAPRQRWQRADFAIPSLAVGETWTAVGVRSDLFISRTPGPTSPPALEARLVLDSCADPGTILTPAQEKEAGHTNTDPWHDITAIQAVDDAASRLVVGYADGSVQVLVVRSASSVEVQSTFAPLSRFEIAAVSAFGAGEHADGVWIGSVSKRGQLRIHMGGESKAWQIDSDGTASAPTASTPSSRAATPGNFRSAAFNHAPADGGGGTRAWSVLLRQHWIAVGLTGENAVYIYPILRGAGLELGEPMYVATRLRSSVFALATAPAHSHIPPWLLFAGFYDGTVRVYDTRTLQEPRRSREMHVIGVLKEDRPADAVYSLTFGGPRAHLLIAGGARHAEVRVFDVEFLQHYSVPLLPSPGASSESIGWTAFALPSTDSPQYAVAATATHLLGVTDRKFWCFNFASPLLTTLTSPPIAYFGHTHPELMYSTCTPMP